MFEQFEKSRENNMNDFTDLIFETWTLTTVSKKSNYSTVAVEIEDLLKEHDSGTYVIQCEIKDELFLTPVVIEPSVYATK